MINQFGHFTHQMGYMGFEVGPRANPSCKACYGTGLAGRLCPPNGDKIDLTCACVVRASAQRVPWLQRHGKDLQPWLRGEDDGTTKSAETSTDTYQTTANTVAGSEAKGQSEAGN